MTAIVPLDDGATWDGFVAGARDSTFCHLAGWREVMSDVLGHECRYRVAIDERGEWRGVLPLVRVRSRAFGDYLISLPFLNSGGPLGAPEAQGALAGDAAAAARRLGVDLLELRARVPVPADLRVSHRKVAVVLALPDSPEALWRRFPPKLRAQIRRPEKEGLVARFGPEQQAAFYHVFARHMRDLGTPVLPRALFERIARVFPRHVVFAAVYRDREPLAAGCGFVWGDEFEITWAADLRAHRRAAPNMLLYWALMRHMIERGVRAFNFGRCTLGAGTHRFKRQWGGEDVPLPWAQWTSGAVSATPSPDRPVYRLAAAVWRRLPLPLANAVGPALARQLP